MSASSCTCCGACCATYRVVFPLDETQGDGVPANLAIKLDARFCFMRGTNRRPQRCVALSGTIGQSVSCAIYQRRPSPCRAFAPEAAAGVGDIACANARRLHGLPPLGGSYAAVPFA